MKVAFVISIYDSFGEREHATAFARQLAVAGVETCFVVTAPVAAHLSARGLQPRTFTSADDARRVLDELAPDWLIACEAYNFGRELNEMVARAPCRVATMDGTGMGATINANPLAFADDAATKIAIPERFVRLLPCPVNTPRPPDGRSFCWPLFPGLARSDGEAARRRWGIARDVRVAVLAIAPWALAAAERLGRGAHYRTLIATLIDALAATAMPVELVIISPVEAPPVAHGRVTVRSSRYLPPDVYEELLLGCDLVLSDNVIQTSVAKAFAARIPTIVVVDSRAAAPPWNIFPLRLRFPDDAPYCRALAPVELADAATLRARVAAALAGEARDDGGYRAALAQLPTADVILAAVNAT